MAAAMAAFSDSTPTVGMETWAADERHSVPTPWASLPIIRPHRPLRSVAASESAGVVETAGMAANSLIPFCRSVATAVAEAMPCTKGTRKRGGAERFGIGRAHRALEKQHAGGAEGLGRAHDGAGVSRILNSVQHHDQGLAVEQLRKLPLARLHQRDHALRG